MSKANEIEDMIKSTENSINETCKLLQDIPFINKKSADKMFEEMGFEKTEPYKNIIFYENEEMEIEFWTDMKWVDCDGKMSAKLLQAINLKCRELGWIGGEDE